MKKELKDWLKLVEEGEAYSYIKKNRLKHDSGYGCFEVGYMTIDENAKMQNKFIVGNYTDHIWFNKTLKDLNIEIINIDVTLDGYIRFHSRERIKWDTDFGLSTMGFEKTN